MVNGHELFAGPRKRFNPPPGNGPAATQAPRGRHFPVNGLKRRLGLRGCYTRVPATDGAHVYHRL